MKKITSWRSRRTGRAGRTRAGFTLPEVLVIVVIIGILMGIAAPGWLGFQTNQALGIAQDEVFQAIRQAQLQALQTRQTWQIKFRDKDQAEWSVALAGSTTAQWQPLAAGARIAPNETTLSRNSEGAYFVEFNYRGNVTPPFGRLSLSSRRGGQQRRCVFVSTLLGVLRKAAGKECYP